jgi:membrane-bound lytic murein transglycosylase C
MTFLESLANWFITMHLKSKLCLAAALLAAVACSPGEVVRVAQVAATGDVASVGRLATDKAIGYAANPAALNRDIKKFNHYFEALVEALTRAVTGRWGKDDVKIPTQKKYVKYTQNYKSRALVDFDTGIVTVETVDTENPLASLKNAIVTTLLTPHDPRAVDLYSAKTVKLGDTPFLLGEVKDHQGKEIRWAWRAERFADHLIQSRLQTRASRSGTQTITVNFVKIALEKDHLHIRARKYRQHVETYAHRYQVSKNLVFAVIKTESDFNPWAISSAPAFGLMQIVPGTAGQDVNRYLKRPGLPSEKILLNPQENILYGSVFLHILDTQYLAGIRNQLSREYCVIAAYNTGAGNVLRTFDKNRDRAPDKINRLAPLEVYQTLKTNLPYSETRRYLTKVMHAKKEFINF